MNEGYSIVADLVVGSKGGGFRATILVVIIEETGGGWWLYWCLSGKKALLTGSGPSLLDKKVGSSSG
jgi:hypothetical protein